jgi:hypothetical protein
VRHTNHANEQPATRLLPTQRPSRAMTDIRKTAAGVATDGR